MTKEAFAEKFGDQPRRDDLTFIVPKQDDPTEQVQTHERCMKWHCSSLDLPLTYPVTADIYIFPRGSKGWGEDPQSVFGTHEGCQCC